MLKKSPTYERLISLYRRLADRIGLKKLLVLLLLIALLGLGMYRYLRPTPGTGAPLLFEAARGEFFVKITELGELNALDSVTISAQDDLPIIYLAPEGATVAQGDVLVRFDAAKHEVSLDDSNAALQVAKADLRKAETALEAQKQKLAADVSRFEAEVELAQLALDELKKKPLPDELAKAEMEFEKAKAAYENAAKNMELLPGLAEKGFITRDTLEKAELEHLEAKANLQVARFNLDRVAEGATDQELEQARIRLEQAKFALEKAREQASSELQSYKAAVAREKANVERAEKLVEKAEVSLRRGVLKAPRDGLVVYARTEGKEASKVQLGMIPFEGQPLIYLPDLSTMVVNTEVSEFDIGKVSAGAFVEVRPEAYPGAVFQGSVFKIGTLARLKRAPDGTATGNKVFDVTVKIEETDPRLKPGLTATLDIIAHHRKDAVFVPLSAITVDKGQTVVYVSKKGKIEARKVALGPSNEHSVIIEDGLRAGEMVVLK
jgi:HlyD family secretion protein